MITAVSTTVTLLTGYGGHVSRNKSYDDSCGVARALDAVGERWALLLVRDLLLGPKRYADLQAGLRGISPTVLAARLRELTDAGVVRRRRLPPPAASHVYELTAWGRDLEPVLLALGMWGSHSPAPPPAAPLGLDSLVLALRGHLDATRVTGDSTLQLTVDDSVLTMHTEYGHVHLGRGEARAPDAALTTGALTLQQMAFTGRSLDDALDHGDATLTGNYATARHLLDLLRVPA